MTAEASPSAAVATPEDSDLPDGSQRPDVTPVTEAHGGLWAGYETDDERPLGSYLALMGAYGVAVGGLVLLGRRTGVTLPERIRLPDLLLAGVAAHKLSRTLTKDAIASPLRAGFTQHAGSAGPGEVAERPRGTGVRHALGELATCPFCVGQWVSTGFTAGLVFAPRQTRLVATVFAVRSLSDVLQFAYTACELAVHR